MNRPSLLRAFTLCAVSSILVNAQTPATPPQQPPATRTKQGTGTTKPQTPARANKKSTETDVPALSRRATATTLLTTLADDARSFRDSGLRARVQARVADALWKADETRARQLFRRAWEDLEAYEKGDSRKADGDVLKLSPNKSQTFISAASLRGEILRLAALRDRKLADEFLEKLNEKLSKDASSGTLASSLELSAGESNRIDLARQLLGSSHTERALELASPLLNRVTEQTVRFLSLLRVKDPTAADTQFTQLLAHVAGDASSDAVTVSFLSSYVLSPLVFVSVTREGFTNSSIYGTPLPPPDLSPTLRAAFFRTAAQILLRPLTPEQLESTAAGRAGTYFTILRLLPQFEKFAPDYVPTLRTQLDNLSAPIYTEVFNPKTNQNLTEGLTAKKVNNSGGDLLDLSKAKNASDRDAIYINAAQNAAAKGDEKAREYADKIDDVDLRQQVRAYTDFMLVTVAIEAKQPEKVVRLSRSDYLTTFQRAWALTEAAGLLKRDDEARAAEVLTDATTEARRIDETSPDRIRALLAVASQLHDLDPPRGWEMANEIVKVANNSKDFSGEDGRMGMRLKVKDTLTEKNFSAANINLSSLFTRLAKDDLYVAISTAQNLAAEGPRSAALISIARAILDEPPPPPPAGRR